MSSPSFTLGISTRQPVACTTLSKQTLSIHHSSLVLVSAGLAAFCMTFCCFGFVSADLGWSRCFLRDLGLVSAGLAAFFMVLRGLLLGSAGIDSSCCVFVVL